MPGRIPEELLDRIREATDIVEVVSEHVQLKQRGRNYFGLCPFHTEKTPSFSVNPELQIYRCFGCGEGGNVFKFLQEIDRVSFLEAVDFLAQRSGIPLPRDGSRADGELADELYRANELAAKYFCHMLRQEVGGPGLRYLHERGLSDETIDRFAVGYAPAGWSSFLEVAGRRGFTPAILEKAGLALASRQGSGHYDRFRDRITFTIANASGRAIGFGARALKPEEEPKYLNSPETAIYHKSSVLYGLSHTREEIRRRDGVAVVEGYMDLLSLVQGGVGAVVATSGTALTAQHCRVLGRYAHRIALLFDGDAAGAAAAARGIEVLVGSEQDTRVVSLPSGHDPDTFIRERGAAQVEALLEGAVPALEFYLGRLAEEIDVTTVNGKARAVERLMPLLERCKESVRRDLMLRQAAQNLGVDEVALREDLQRALEHPRRTRQPEPEPEAQVEQLPDPPSPERAFMGLLLLHPRYIGPTGEKLTAEAFTDPRLRRLAQLLFDGYAGSEALDVALLMSETDDASLVQIISMCAMEGFDEDQVEVQWQDNVRIFQQEVLTRQIQKIRRQQQEAVAAGRQDDVARLSAEGERLRRTRQEQKDAESP